ncbi:MAG: acyltransferase, partial [Microthrixaceae bacterium]
MNSSGSQGTSAKLEVGLSNGSSSKMRLPALDGCRALAAVGVLITHVSLLSGFSNRSTTLGPYLARMDVGVSVFFVLSGFLLYRPFVAARFAGQPSSDIGSYARRRVLRIIPAYWVALTVVGFILRAPGFVEPHSIVSHYLLLQIYDSTQ